MRLLVLVIVVVLAGLPAEAQVKGAFPDQRYCEELSQLYMRYIGNPETQPRNVRRNDAAADEALAQCQKGNSAAAIPVLERRLLDNGFTLPAH